MPARLTLTTGKPRLELTRTDPSQPAVLTMPPQGPMGQKGQQGNLGPQGVQGNTGVQGERGPPGDTSAKVLAMSALAASQTGNLTEAVLATITIPARTMGAQGRLRITAFFSMPNTANNKTFRVRFNGIAGTIYYSEVFGTGIQTAHAIVEIANRNAVNSQIGGPVGNSGVGSSANAIVTSAVNTDLAAMDVVITGQLANAGETIKLEGYVVELLMPPTQAAVGLYFAGDGILINTSTFEVKVDRTTVPPVSSPGFTGNPTAPTQPDATDNDRLATTAFVHNLIDALAGLYLTSDPEDARAALGLGALALLNQVAWAQINASLIASATDMRQAADQKFLTPKVAFDAQVYVNMPDTGTNLAVDLAAGLNFTCSLTAGPPNRVLQFPTGIVVGQSGFMDFVQSAGGGKTLDFDTGYSFDQGAKPVIDTGASRVTSLYYHVRSASEVRIGMAFKGVRAAP
jgi:hypothetical protein